VPGCGRSQILARRQALPGRFNSITVVSRGIRFQPCGSMQQVWEGGGEWGEGWNKGVWAYEAKGGPEILDCLENEESLAD